MQEGEQFQKEFYISIENLSLGTTINPNSTFTLNVRKWSNNAIVETYSNLTLNWATDNHIVKRIGDMNMVWDDVDKKFNMVGEYPNQSDYIRIEMAPALKAGGLPQDSLALPFGFYGPMKSKSFTIISGSTANASPKVVGDTNTDLTSSFVLGSGSVPTLNFGSTFGGAGNDFVLLGS